MGNATRALGMGLLLFGSIARADNFDDVPLGGKTAAMGGAAIAGGRDSAMPVLNPAGLALVPASTVSVSASAYSLRYTHHDAWFGPGRPADSTTFSAYPSGLAYVLHFGDQERPFVLGASFSAPMQTKRSVVGGDTDSAGFRTQDAFLADVIQYQAALSVALGLGKLRLGASAILGHYAGTFVINSALFGRGQMVFPSQNESNTSDELAGLVGMQLDLDDRWSVGASARTPSLHLAGAASGQVGRDTGSITGGFSFAIPARVGFGVQLRASPWVLALDLSFTLPGDAAWSFDGGHYETQTSVQGALGVERTLESGNSLRAGLFARSSSFGYQLYTKQGDRYDPAIAAWPLWQAGPSFGYGMRLGPVDTTLGVQASVGADRKGVPLEGTQRGVDPIAPSGRESSTFEIGVIAFVSATVDVSFEQCFKDPRRCPRAPGTERPEEPPPSPNVTPPPPPPPPAEPPPECSQPADCGTRGALPRGYQWVCRSGKCVLSKGKR